MSESGAERGLFAAVVAVAAGLELTSTLRRIVKAAVDLSGARYGAMGVLGNDGTLTAFIHVGMDDETVSLIGDTPRGRGILGLLVDHPVPLRITDIEQHSAAAGFPSNHPPMHSFLGVPVRVRGRVFGNLYLTEKHDGARFTSEDERAVTALAAAAAVAIENARLFEHTRMRARWQEAVAHIDGIAFADGDPGEVLEAVAVHALELSRGRLAAIALPSPDGEFAIERVAPSDQPGAEDLLGMSCSATRLPDALEHAVAFPLSTPDRVLGLLVVDWLTPVEVPDSDARQLIADFAAQCAVTLMLAEARREQERLAVYEDRDRIARDLHDLVIQRLFATGMLLQGTSRVADLPQPAAERLSRAVDELDETIREIRQTIFALHEPIEDGGDGARGRILREAVQSGALLGFDPAVRFVGTVDALVTADLTEHLVAVLREALTNAAKHARAGRVEVLVEADAGGVTLCVTDDGVGVGEGGRRSGLANLSARAAAAGGTCIVERVSDEGGTRLTWSAPTT